MLEFYKYFKQEFKLISSDTAVLTTYLITTVLIVIFYSYLYSHEILTKMPVAVIDEDQSSISHNITRMLAATPQLDLDYKSINLLDAQERLKRGKIRGIILIPQQFYRDMQKNNHPSISIYCDASYMLYYKQLYISAVTTLKTLGSQIGIKNMMAQGLTKDQAISVVQPVQGISSPLYNINSGYGTFLMPMVFLIAIQILQLSAMGTMAGTQRERKLLHRLFPLAKSRIGSAIVVLARGSAYFLMSFFILIIIIGFVMSWFNFPQRGNPFEALLFLIPFILSVTFLGITLLHFFRHREDALMVVTIFSIPSLFLCGISWPTIAFPEWIKYLSYFVPTTLGVKGFFEITQFGASFGEIKTLWYQLWGLTFFYFILAIFTIRKFVYVEYKNKLNK